MENKSQNQQCCPEFNPSLWDDKLFGWDNKKFITDKVFTLFYIPLNFGSVMTRITKKVKDSGALNPDYLCLSEHRSKWSMNLLLAVDKEIPGAENVTLSGKYISKTYEGGFEKTGEWTKDFDSFVKNKGLDIKNMYMWYTTCPKCAKKYGKNYVVLIGKYE